MSQLPSYAVVTPARNEAQYIGLTLASMIAQTHLPLKWVIVSDGSVDGTDEIVQSYQAEHPWIELIRLPERTERHFAGKVYAFNAGYEKILPLHADAVVSLDGDISFDSSYFVFLLEKLAADSTLGLVGTPFQELTGSVYDYRFTSPNHVSGACQVFRRECFEDIGGYLPIKGGSIDHLAVLTARMKGWRTRTFTDKICLHHRGMGSAHSGSAVAISFKHGKKDYIIGNHPLWEVFRVVYQLSRPPVVIGGMALGAGYCTALCRRTERVISPELMRFHRGEQIARIKNLFRIGSRRKMRLENAVKASSGELPVR